MTGFRLCILLILWSTSGQAQLQEQELVLHVIEQFPSVQSARQGVAVAEALNKAAAGAFDIVAEADLLDRTGYYDYNFLDARVRKPTSLFGIDLYAGFRRSLGVLPIYEGQMETLDRGEWNVGIKVPLLRGFWIDERRANFRRTAVQIDREKLQLQAVELKELERVLHSYWNWKLAIEQLRIQKGLLEISELRNDWLSRKAKAGDVAKFEQQDNLRTLLQRKSFVLQSQLDLKNAEAQLLLYISDPDLQMRIKGLTDQPPKETTLTYLPSDIQNLKTPVQGLIDRALGTRPEFKDIALQVTQLNIDEELQRNQFLPQFDVRAEYARDRGTGPTYLQGSDTKIAIQLSVPLQYRLARGRLDAVKASTERLRFDRQLLERQWTTQITQLQNNLITLIERRNLSEQEMTLAMKLEDGERSRFRFGETNVLTVNLREQASAEAQLRFIETTVDTFRNYITLNLMMGQIPFQQN